MSETRKWEIVEDGYDRRSRFVSYPSGRIIGEVSGCAMKSNSDWRAGLRSSKGYTHIGDFTTEELAKYAVESARPKKGTR
jgi:hypothetical protein